MKHTLLATVFLLSTLAAGAQNIKNGTQWTDDFAVYKASTNYNSDDGNIKGGILFAGYSPHEGGFEFILLPQSKKGEYIITADETDFLPLNATVGDRVQHLHQDGLDLLIVRNAQGRATDVLYQSSENIWTIHDNAIHTQLRGTYQPSNHTSTNSAANARWIITDKTITSGLDGKTYKLRYKRVYDQPIPAAQVGQQIYLFTPTVDGLDIEPIQFDEDEEEYQTIGQTISLTWADTSKSRFQFLSQKVCTPNMLSAYSLDVLRIMRNDILARHGYVFSSADLIEYFSQQPWYKPTGDNASIHLSLIEQLNIELIQSTEEMQTKWMEEEDEE